MCRQASILSETFFVILNKLSSGRWAGDVDVAALRYAFGKKDLQTEMWMSQIFKDFFFFFKSDNLVIL